jgi:hypothetical protein
MHSILEHLDQIEAIIDTAVEDLCAVRPGIAKRLAVDSKAIESFAKHGPQTAEAVGRRDTEAKWDMNGTIWIWTVNRSVCTKLRNFWG